MRDLILIDFIAEAQGEYRFDITAFAKDLIILILDDVSRVSLCCFIIYRSSTLGALEGIFSAGIDDITLIIADHPLLTGHEIDYIVTVVSGMIPLTVRSLKL